MSVASSRIEAIEVALRRALAPSVLRVEDESHLHHGHAGAKDGRGHFRVHIVATAFEGCSRVKRHRMLYEALGDQMTTDIHALAIHAYTPAESPSDL